LPKRFYNLPDSSFQLHPTMSLHRNTTDLSQSLYRKLNCISSRLSPN